MIYKQKSSAAGTVAMVAGAAVLGAAVAVACLKLIPCMCRHRHHSCWDDIAFDDEDEFNDYAEEEDDDIYPADMEDAVIQPKPEKSEPKSSGVTEDTPL